jgi:hypothetical protein
MQHALDEQHLGVTVLGVLSGAGPSRGHEALRATHGEQVHVHAELLHRPMINNGSDMT